MNMNVTVNFNRLWFLVDGYIDSFNDCFCCPCSYNGCPRQDEGIDNDECAGIIISYLKGELENETI